MIYSTFQEKEASGELNDEVYCATQTGISRQTTANNRN